jgi:hypothetical protein
MSSHDRKIIFNFRGKNKKAKSCKYSVSSYSIKDIDGGSILILSTNDTQVLNAIHQFMNFQSSQHMGH